MSFLFKAVITVTIDHSPHVHLDGQAPRENRPTAENRGASGLLEDMVRQHTPRARPTQRGGERVHFRGWQVHGGQKRNSGPRGGAADAACSERWSTVKCELCSFPFTFFRRRHHCRSCGKVLVCHVVLPGNA